MKYGGYKMTPATMECAYLRDRHSDRIAQLRDAAQQIEKYGGEDAAIAMTADWIADLSRQLTEDGVDLEIRTWRKDFDRSEHETIARIAFGNPQPF